MAGGKCFPVFSRRPQPDAEDKLEELRKKLIENRYRGTYSIDNNELLGIIERLQTAEKKLKELNVEIK